MGGFISYRELFEAIGASPSQIQLFADLAQFSDNRRYVTQHEDFSSAWIFTFLDTLDHLLLGDQGLGIQELSQINDLYLRIEEHILEDSGFLDYFPENRQISIKENARDKLLVAYSRTEALRIVSDSSELKFLNDLYRKIKLAGNRILDCDMKVRTFTAVMNYTPRMLSELTDTFIPLTRLLLSTELVAPVGFRSSLLQLLYREENKLSCSLAYKEITPEIRQAATHFTRLIGLEILLARLYGMSSDTYLRDTFLRCLFLLSARQPVAIRNLAFQSLLGKSVSIAPFSWEDLSDFSLEQFIEKISCSEVTDSETDTIGQFDGQGLIMLANDNLLVTPSVTPVERERLSSFAFFMDGQVEFRTSSKPELDIPHCSDLVQLSHKWDELSGEYRTHKPFKKISIAKERPPKNAEVLIRINNILPSMPLLAFATIIDEQYEGSGVLHVRQVSRIRLESLIGVLNIGDIFLARVMDTTEFDGETGDPDNGGETRTRISFSILDNVGDYISQNYYKNDTTSALLVAQKDNLLIWCSEEGVPVFTPVIRKYDLQPGDTYSVNFIEVAPNGFVKGRVLEQVYEKIEPQIAVSRLIRAFINDNKQYDCSGNDDGETYATLSPGYVRNLICLFDIYSWEEKLNYISRFNYLCISRLLCLIAGESGLEEYYASQIACMVQLYRLAMGNDPEILHIDEEIASGCPRLKSMVINLDILRPQPLRSRIHDLEEYLRLGFNASAILQRLMISRELLADYPAVTQVLDGEILAQLSFYQPEAEEQPEQVHFGIENDLREFKVSVVFPPENTLCPDLDKQMSNILLTVCGFLNAQGGTLYIGVSDAGYPQGIEMDLHFLHCDDDRYELHLRRNIVRYLSQDINSLIRIEFREFSGKKICAVAVPSYHEVVMYKDAVYQRQGNSTRKLNSADLKTLKLRMRDRPLSSKAGKPQFPDSESYNLENNPGAVKMAAKARSSKKHLINTIPTSVLTNDEALEYKTVACLSVLQSGKFVVTDNFPDRDQLRIILPICSNDIKKSLVQIYANGFVNRVELANILKKQREYEYANALYTHSEIIFMGIASEKDFIFLHIRDGNKEYIKIVPVVLIKTNISLSLKGIPLVSSSFTQIIRVDILTQGQAANVRDILCETDDTLGSLITSPSVSGTVRYLEELFRIPLIHQS